MLDKLLTSISCLLCIIRVGRFRAISGFMEVPNLNFSLGTIIEWLWCKLYILAMRSHQPCVYIYFSVSFNYCVSTVQLIQFVYNFSQKLSLNIRENRYKIVHVWYLTPKQLIRMCPWVADTCWKGGYRRGLSYHIWWDCALISSFLKLRQKKIQWITGLIVSFCLRLFILLHNFEQKDLLKKAIC